METQTAPMPYLVLKVNRDQVVPDTLKLLQSLNSSDFKKPVKVKVLLLDPIRFVALFTLWCVSVSV